MDLPGGGDAAAQGKHEDDDHGRPFPEGPPPPFLRRRRSAFCPGRSCSPVRGQEEGQHDADDPHLVLQGVAGTHAVGIVQEDPAGCRHQHMVQEAGGQEKQRHRGDAVQPLPEVNIERPGVKRKPAPDMVLKALNELGSSTGEAVYVGDSEVDLETAKNAGIPCIAVLWGFRSRERLIESGAQLLAEEPEDILDLL
ncbi:MAG: HAD family hydrolase [Lachnospiraceae bacterium]|nr:HAD family hydrolase [Lachnospiraceae bacterium]